MLIVLAGLLLLIIGGHLIKTIFFWMWNLQNSNFNSSQYGDHELKTSISYLNVNTTSWGITLSGVRPCITGCWFSDVTERIHCLETSGTKHTVTQRRITEDLMSHPHLCESVFMTKKSRMVPYVKIIPVYFTNRRKRSGKNRVFVLKQVLHMELRLL